jgi:hypothetical protein
MVKVAQREVELEALPGESPSSDQSGGILPIRVSMQQSVRPHHDK